MSIFPRGGNKMKYGYGIAAIFLSLWSSVSVFSQNDIFDDVTVEMTENVPIEEYNYIPDNDKKTSLSAGDKDENRHSNEKGKTNPYATSPRQAEQ